MNQNQYTTGDLFSGICPAENTIEPLADGAVILRGYATAGAPALMETLREILAAAPFRHMITPGGYRMSVAMTNCGRVGWASDQTGYRYDAIDPDSGFHWPPMPESFTSLATGAAAQAGFAGFEPDACLINRYEPGARLSLHQDKDEQDFSAPIVSVSLGLPAVFLFGTTSRKDRPRRIRLTSGDVAVWGGPARLAYHGIASLAGGDHPHTGPYRINLTFRKAL